MIRENNITDPNTNLINDPIKDTLDPLRTNFNAIGSVRRRISVMGFVDTLEHCLPEVICFLKNSWKTPTRKNQNWGCIIFLQEFRSERIPQSSEKWHLEKVGKTLKFFLKHWSTTGFQNVWPITMQRCLLIGWKYGKPVLRCSIKTYSIEALDFSVFPPFSRSSRGVIVCHLSLPHQSPHQPDENIFFRPPTFPSHPTLTYPQPS